MRVNAFVMAKINYIWLKSLYSYLFFCVCACGGDTI